MYARFMLFPFMLMMGACASNVPKEIREDISGEHITLDAVHSDINRYTGHKIRWGGIISSVQNKATDTWIEVVGKQLGFYGRPQPGDQSEGRFLARIDGFLDPAIYKVDRPVTVYGVLEGSVQGNIGEYSYTYPLVKAYSHYLWDDYGPRSRYARNYYDYPYRYYPYYFYPYWFNFGFHYGHFPHYYFGSHQHYRW
jgi:outer membrane lipoprotein